MDENQNSLTHYKIENTHMMQQLSSGIEKIAIEQNDYQYEVSTTHESMISSNKNSKKTINYLHFVFENTQNTSNSSDPNISLDSIEDMANQDAMMLLTDVPSTSKSQGYTTILKRSTLHETKQRNIDMQAAKNYSCQLTLGGFSGHEVKPKNQNRSYQSYSNLIKMYCCKCKIVSKNVIDYRCYKCQTSLLYQCIKCSGLYKKHIAVLNHIKYECYKLPTYYCSMCIYTTYQKSNLVKHIQKKHSPYDESEYAYQCSVCKKKFKKQQYMLKHERICDREATLVCQYCPYKTKVNEVMVQHVQKKHQQWIPDNHKSSDCRKMYQDPQSLYQHLKFNCRGNKFFQCDHCHFQIDKKFALVKHIQKVHPSFFKRMNLLNN